MNMNTPRSSLSALPYISLLAVFSSISGCALIEGDTFEGKEIVLTMDNEEVVFTDDRGYQESEWTSIPENRYTFDFSDGPELGIPSKEEGVYISSVTKFLYTRRIGVIDVNYSASNCEFPSLTVEVNGEEYGLLYGTFIGRICKRKYDSSAPANAPESISVSGQFVGSVEESYF